MTKFKKAAVVLLATISLVFSGGLAATAQSNTTSWYSAAGGGVSVSKSRLHVYDGNGKLHKVKFGGRFKPSHKVCPQSKKHFLRYDPPGGTRGVVSLKPGQCTSTGLGGTYAFAQFKA